MSSDPFLPFGNGVSVGASTTSTGAGPMPPSPSLVITNRSTASPAWVTWSPSSVPTAVFPAAGDSVGAFGVEVAPGAQVSIGTNGQNAYVSVVLLTGTGIVTLVPGTGV